MNHFIKRICVIIIINLTIFVRMNMAATNATLQLRNWLILGPQNISLPALSKSTDFADTAKELLNSEFLSQSEFQPIENENIDWFDQKDLRWHQMKTDDDGKIVISVAESSQIMVAYLATYIKTDHWEKAKLFVECPQLFKVFLDGEKVAEKLSANKMPDSEESSKIEPVSAELKLQTGKHLLLIKTVYAPESKNEWEFKATIESPKDTVLFHLTNEILPERIFTVEDLLYGPKVSFTSISPDGDLVAIGMQQSISQGDDSESWIEIRNFADGSLVHSYAGGMNLSGFTWLPKGKKYSYLSNSGEGKTLWVVDLETGAAQAVIKNVKDFGSYEWAPNEDFVIYSITEKYKDDDRKVKHLRGLDDRWSYWRNKSFLYQVTVPGGVTRRLTAGDLTTDFIEIHPNGKSMLFARSIEDYSERPYHKTELYQLNFANLSAKLLWKGNFFRSVSWSPDGQKFLVLAGPSTFGNLGKNVPEGKIPNDYDTQAYIFDTEMKNGEAISKKFAPTIEDAVWNKADGCIYLQAEDREFVRIFQYNPKSKKFTQIPTLVDVVSRFTLAQEKLRMVCYGTGVSQPTNVFKVDLQKNKSTLLAEPEKEFLKNVRFGESETWNFNNKEGVQIDGRIYYPPGFNPSKKYPAIVYYYGGTSPVSRDFGGRYPKELWTANGYVVYVLQPSGATGYGQEFSAHHVNDWGKITSEEIIEGSKKFIAAHPFVDGKKVGCIGASYGGFMTQLLLTKTDIFAAAVSHAGISALTSYWGEGYWGYSYSAVATANSFPWNRKDIYVDQSPLFAADKITTPLLLTHGASDTNVPPGESEQMYIALKLLGKDVEYLKFDGQDHWILKYSQRRLWTKSIIAWFDKYLKDQPGFWEDLYPKEEK